MLKHWNEWIIFNNTLAQMEKGKHNIKCQIQDGKFLLFFFFLAFFFHMWLNEAISVRQNFKHCDRGLWCTLNVVKQTRFSLFKLESLFEQSWSAYIKQ